MKAQDRAATEAETTPGLLSHLDLAKTKPRHEVPRLPPAQRPKLRRTSRSLPWPGDRAGRREQPTALLQIDRWLRDPEMRKAVVSGSLRTCLHYA
jgi:hypothetical protein